MKRCHGRLHYDRKFQIFIFLIRHNNANKGVFCLKISYLQIKSYNVLKYNNCSTDWSFPLTFFSLFLVFVCFICFCYFTDPVSLSNLFSEFTIKSWSVAITRNVSVGESITHFISIPQIRQQCIPIEFVENFEMFENLFVWSRYEIVYISRLLNRPLSTQCLFQDIFVFQRYIMLTTVMSI